MDNKNYKEAMKVSVVTIIGNFGLSVFKFISGVLGSSSAMVSDAVHSLSDVLSTIIVMIGIKISNKKSDNSHQYGHERFEAVAALILSMLLLGTGILIGYTGISKIITGINGKLATPSVLALVAALISILVKEAMYWYTKIVAKKIKSTALMADAWHHRSDALSSIGSLIGIAGSKMGFPILDPIASLIICLFILKVSLDILKDSVYKLVDKAADDETISKMKSIILNVDGVMEIDLIKTRLFGSKIYVDVEIGADKNQTLASSHAIAVKVHDEIENIFSDVKHCMVHVNPK